MLIKRCGRTSTVAIGEGEVVEERFSKRCNVRCIRIDPKHLFVRILACTSRYSARAKVAAYPPA